MQRGIAGLVTSCDIKKGNLVGALLIIAARNLYRVSGITDIHKLYAFHNTTFVDIEAWNNPLGQTHVSALNKCPNFPALVDRY